MPNGIILNNENTYLSVQVGTSSQLGTIRNDLSGLSDTLGFRTFLGTLGTDSLNIQVGISSQRGTIGNDLAGLTDTLGFRTVLGTFPYSFPKTSRTGQQKQEWYN